MRLLNRSAGRLSRHRRGPFAGLVLIFLGLLLTGGFYSMVNPASADTSTAQSAQVTEGRQLFLVGCAYCHGQNGQGVLQQDGQQLGPTLVGVGAAAVDFQVGTGRMPAQQPGAQIPRKKPVYNQDEIDALAAYVASLGPGPSVPSAAQYSTEGLSDSEKEQAIARGGQIFLTNCTACHNYAGSGGAMPSGGYAPQIRGVPSRYIYEALLTGPQGMPTFSNGNLSPEEKRDVIAYINSLKEQPSYGGFGLGSLGPVSEGLFAWIVGIGGLVGFAVWIAAHTTRSNKKKTEAAA